MNRSTYLRRGAALMALKYAGDATLVAFGADQRWSPADYFDSVGALYGNLWQHAHTWLLPALTLWTLPFLWVGVSYTRRRAEDAGLSPWIALGFFVPYANYLLMFALTLVPSVSASSETEPVERRDLTWRDMAAAIGLGTTAAFVMVVLSVEWIGSYGVTLFLATPFVSAAVGAFVLNRRADVTLGTTIGVTILTFAVEGAALLALGREGAGCLLMALPLAFPIALAGAMFGREVGRGNAQPAPAMMALLLLPTAAALEPPHAAGRTLHEVRSAVVVDAPAARVWPHVVAFAPLDEALSIPFRLGVAFPQFARIDGQGVGAVRYCVFSTGAFVEPITAWEPDRRLAFDVTASPPPMRELSPYRNIHPPHLDGYLRSKRGEFRLVSLPDGRTRLEGSTWYEIEMAPEGYWQLWTDYLIHRIHERVLAHIKAEAEAMPSSPS